MRTLKAKKLKNNNTWQKYGFIVFHLANGYWLSYFKNSENYNTIAEVKKRIKQIRLNL